MNTLIRQRPRSVLDELKNVFPAGTVTPKNFEGMTDEHAPWLIAPNLPTDVFAGIAHICRVGGVIGYFEPDPRANGTSPRFKLPPKTIAKLVRFGSEWRDEADLANVQKLWTEFIGLAQNAPIYARSTIAQAKDLKWCEVAFKLLIVADEAARNIGRVGKDGKDNPFTEVILSLYHKTSPAEDAPPIGGSDMRHHGKFPSSLAVFADPDVVCVQPKSRVSQVGCTLRNLTAHLALLPPRSAVRCQWSQSAKNPRFDDSEALDILLIPLPYQINGRSFEEVDPPTTTRSNSVRPNWANFEIHQPWLDNPNGIATLAVNLVKAAQEQTRIVDAIIFPEYALDWNTFKIVCDAIWRDFPDLEFIIAGSSTNCETPSGEGTKERANYVLTALNYDPGVTKSEDRRVHVASRRKHHRWCLDSTQVNDYALASSLNPAVRAWWENHKIDTPELYFHQFRESSTFVTMICEDLARNDPCHEILRSVGPNLLFALLMDGPQLEQRWSARYASSLADDPGSSVLTFTSFGLIDRMNKTQRFDESRAIALWKDDTGRLEKIMMPAAQEKCGVLVSLHNVVVEEQTIDGRKTIGRSWRFSSQQPLVL